MATTPAIDDALIEEARSAGGHKTQKEAVAAALREYVDDRRQAEILPVFGTVPLDPAHDCKEERHRRYADHLPIRPFAPEE